jgi:hypothetical protein
VTVRVDALRHRTGPRGRKSYCHMTADTLEELHAMAERIGRKRCWFEKSRRGVPHYDIDEEFRASAVEAGAVERRIKRTAKDFRAKL